MDLTLTEKMALIGLKNQRQRQMTMAKKTSLRAVAAAVIVEKYIELGNASYVLDSHKTEDASFVGEITGLFKQADNVENLLDQTNKFSKRNLETIESAIVSHLENKHYIRVNNSLLSCDLEFETAGIIVREYVVNQSIYEGFAEEFRAECLEGFSLDKESIALLWLCKESGALGELFSKNELQVLTKRYDELYEQDSFAKELYELTIHRSFENITKRFLKWKSEEISSSFGSGLNFIFPVIERSQAVFIESAAYFDGGEKLLQAIKEKLNHYHIHYTIEKVEDVHLLKINGVYYEAIPFAKHYHIPVHGAQLRKYPVSLQI